MLVDKPITFDSNTEQFRKREGEKERDLSFHLNHPTPCVGIAGKYSKKYALLIYSYLKLNNLSHILEFRKHIIIEV